MAVFSRPVPPPADLETVDTAWGPMEFWKARALALGIIQRQHQVINDDASDHDDVPNKPTADPEELPPPVAADAAYRADIIEQLEAKCDRLSARLDVIEKEREAAQALDDLEQEIEQEEQAQQNPTKH